MTATGDQSEDGGLVERVELLLSSLTSVVSARVILDQGTGTHVHIIATSEVPVSEVSRSVMSALNWGMGFELPPDHITVVQSRLSREELRALLLGPEESDPSSTPAAPESPPIGSTDPESTDPESTDTESTDPESTDPESTDPESTVPQSTVPNTGLLEFSLGATHGATTSVSDLDIHRLELKDLQLDKNPEGGFSISVRLAYNDRSIGAQREAAGTEQDFLEVPASTTLAVIQEFLRAGREDAPSVLLRFLAARRLRHPQHDTIVVLVEAVVRGRRIPLTGAASAADGVERASILATLQATNAFVAGSLIADPAR